jgi:hypothetical protein
MVMMWLALAAVVAIIHAACMALVVIGFAAVAGAIAGTRWARSFALRAAHLGPIQLVCVEVMVSVGLSVDRARKLAASSQARRPTPRISSAIGRPADFL